MSIFIRKLTAEDRNTFKALRSEAILDSPNAYFVTHAEAMDDDYVSTWFSGSRDDIMFGLFEMDQLIGITGLSRESRIKRRHIAWIRSVFVKPGYRGRGFGKLLVAHAIEYARSLEGVDHLQLSVETSNTNAKASYEALGFVTWGREFPAAKFEGNEFGEDYMSLRI